MRMFALTRFQQNHKVVDKVLLQVALGPFLSTFCSQPMVPWWSKWQAPTKQETTLVNLWHFRAGEQNCACKFLPWTYALTLHPGQTDCTDHQTGETSGNPNGLLLQVVMGILWCPPSLPWNCEAFYSTGFHCSKYRMSVCNTSASDTLSPARLHVWSSQWSQWQPAALKCWSTWNRLLQCVSWLSPCPCQMGLSLQAGSSSLMNILAFSSGAWPATSYNGYMGKPTTFLGSTRCSLILPSLFIYLVSSHPQMGPAQLILSKLSTPDTTNVFSTPHWANSQWMLCLALVCRCQVTFPSVWWGLSGVLNVEHCLEGEEFVAWCNGVWRMIVQCEDELEGYSG